MQGWKTRVDQLTREQEDEGFERKNEF